MIVDTYLSLLLPYIKRGLFPNYIQEGAYKSSKCYWLKKQIEPICINPLIVYTVVFVFFLYHGMKAEGF